MLFLFIGVKIKIYIWYCWCIEVYYELLKHIKKHNTLFPSARLIQPSEKKNTMQRKNSRNF